jgi:hypothetical protein
MSVQNARPNGLPAPRRRLADRLFIVGSTAAYGVLMAVVVYALQALGR